MLVLLSILYYALIVASGVCSIIIIVSAFQSEGIGKGIFILICGFYFIYYSLIDFEHDLKWYFIAVIYGGGGLSYYLQGVILRMRVAQMIEQIVP